jgi:hypothetical protein
MTVTDAARAAGGLIACGASAANASATAATTAIFRMKRLAALPPW